MTHEILKRKVIAESDLYQNGIGAYKLYSFLISEISDPNTAESFMAIEGYSTREILRARSDYNRHSQSKSKALVTDRVF